MAGFIVDDEVGCVKKIEGMGIISLPVVKIPLVYKQFLVALA
jgi:hypothetical protein